jgi:hypothetical protein
VSRYRRNPVIGSAIDHEHHPIKKRKSGKVKYSSATK